LLLASLVLLPASVGLLVLGSLGLLVLLVLLVSLLEPVLSEVLRCMVGRSESLSPLLSVFAG